MDKILNNPRLNIYGNDGMVNKYIFLKREEEDKYLYFILKVNKVLNNVFPIKYECLRQYVLIIYKDRKRKTTVLTDLNTLELTINDVLYQLTYDEYIALFRLFVEKQGMITSPLPNPIL